MGFFFMARTFSIAVILLWFINGGGVAVASSFETQVSGTLPGTSFLSTHSQVYNHLIDSEPTILVTKLSPLATTSTASAPTIIPQASSVSPRAPTHIRSQPAPKPEGRQLRFGLWAIHRDGMLVFLVSSVVVVVGPLLVGTAHCTVIAALLVLGQIFSTFPSRIASIRAKAIKLAENSRKEAEKEWEEVKRFNHKLRGKIYTLYEELDKRRERRLQYPSSARELARKIREEQESATLWSWQAEQVEGNTRALG